MFVDFPQRKTIIQAHEEAPASQITKLFINDYCINQLDNRIYLKSRSSSICKIEENK